MVILRAPRLDNAKDRQEIGRIDRLSPESVSLPFFPLANKSSRTMRAAAPPSTSAFGSIRSLMGRGTSKRQNLFSHPVWQPKNASSTIFFYPQGYPQINPQEKACNLAQSGGFFRAMEGIASRLGFKGLTRCEARAGGPLFKNGNEPGGGHRSDCSARRRIRLRSARTTRRSSALHRPI